MADKTENDALTDRPLLKRIELPPPNLQLSEEAWAEIGREIGAAFQELEEAFQKMVEHEAKGGAQQPGQ